MGTMTKRLLRSLACGLVCVIAFSFVENAGASIPQRKGWIIITQPDGTIHSVSEDQALPEIPSGSMVKILEGPVEFAPSAGFIQVVAGDSVATVKAGDRVTVTYDEVTGASTFKIRSGKVNVITGNTTTTVAQGQEVRIHLDRATGATEIKSIKGTIETTTVGVRVKIFGGSAARISADAGTRDVTVESVLGSVEAISMDGKVIALPEGESRTISGSAAGEIQTFEESAGVDFIAEAEPSEPEQAEGSPYR